jgi:hypothetical protein
MLLGQTEFEFFFNSICKVYLKNEEVTCKKNAVKGHVQYEKVTLTL